jgi:hypothetical protein
MSPKDAGAPRDAPKAPKSRVLTRLLNQAFAAASTCAVSIEIPGPMVELR